MLLPLVQFVLLTALLITVTPVTSELVISPWQARSGISLDLVFLSLGSKQQPLCLSGTEESATLSLLVQAVCRDAGFTTFTDFSLVPVNSMRPRSGPEKNQTVSEVSCEQTEDYDTSCRVSPSVGAECQYLVQLTCGSCHFHSDLPAVNTSLSVLSPLYPVLQPGYICEYDFFSDSAQNVGIYIEDINLPDHQYSQDHDNHCLDSVVSLEAGESGGHTGKMEEVATLCGDIGRLLSREIVLTDIKRLRIRFVSGSVPIVRGHRGFNFSIRTLAPRERGDRPILAAYVIGVVLFLLALIAVAVLIRKRSSNRSRRRPRSRSTWQGAAPTPGMSLHDERTNDLSADIERGTHRKESDSQRHNANEGNLDNANNNEDDCYNCYTISYSVPVRKGRHLPSIPKTETETKCPGIREGGSSSNNEPGPVTLHKIYETLDSLSSPAPNPPAPERPAWSLQVPDPGLSAASPLYLMMPDAERRQSLSHTDLTIMETSASKSQARGSEVRDPRMSVTDTAKKVIEKLSVGLSNKLDDGKRRLCAGESETDSECDDVFS